MSRTVDLDLTKVWWQQSHGDITAFGTWFGRDRRPAIVLLPTARIGALNVVPCVVPLDGAWRWADDGDPRHCARVSFLFAQSMGLTAYNQFTLMRITGIIQGHLGDLLTMPPKPTERHVVADAVRTDQYGRQHHSEIAEHV